MFSKLMSRILQLINPRAYVPTLEEKEELDSSLPEVSCGTPMPPVKPAKEEPRLEFTDCEGNWTADSIATEIKIDMAGKIYFKINRVWVEQTAIKSVRFYR